MTKGPFVSDIPSVDYKAVAEKLSARNAELQHQIFQLENIGDQLLGQRDEARRNLADLQLAKDSAQNEVHEGTIIDAKPTA
jgi:hypothetical protein